MRSWSNQSRVVGVVHQHRRAGRRPEHAGLGDPLADERVDQRRLAGAGRAADDRRAAARRSASAAAARSPRAGRPSPRARARLLARRPGTLERQRGAPASALAQPHQRGRASAGAIRVVVGRLPRSDGHGHRRGRPPVRGQATSGPERRASARRAPGRARRSRAGPCRAGSGCAGSRARPPPAGSRPSPARPAGRRPSRRTRRAKRRAGRSHQPRDLGRAEEARAARRRSSAAVSTAPSRRRAQTAKPTSSEERRHHQEEVGRDEALRRRRARRAVPRGVRDHGDERSRRAARARAPRGCGVPTAMPDADADEGGEEAGARTG